MRFVPIFMMGAEYGIKAERALPWIAGRGWMEKFDTRNSVDQLSVKVRLNFANMTPLILLHRD